MAQRVLLGKRGASDFGLYVSKPGSNVQTASASDLLFSTDNNEAPMLIQTGNVSIADITANTQSSFVSWTDGTLNYIPLVMIWNTGDNQVQPVHNRGLILTGGRAAVRSYYEDALVHTVANTTGFYVNAEYNNNQLGTTNPTFRYAAFAIGNSSITSVGP